MTVARVRRLVAIICLLALAGCSDGDDDASPSTTSSTVEATASTPVVAPAIKEYEVPEGSRPHDVAVTPDGIVWYTAQGSGELGRLDPASGKVTEVALGAGARPHGVIVGPDGAPWITDGGLNAIVRVDPATSAVRTFPLPADRPSSNLNTAVFHPDGTLWFTGQAGIYGRLRPATGAIEVFDAPRGAGPYGITVTPGGDIYYASLAGNHLGKVNPTTGAATVFEPPTARQGTRRVWSDSRGRIWCSQWNAGQVAVYDPAAGTWREWKLPGSRPQAYSVYVDPTDKVWLTDFGANAIVRFDPATEAFTSFPLPAKPGDVRQMLGRAGEVWGAESAANKLVVIRY